MGAWHGTLATPIVAWLEAPATRARPNPAASPAPISCVVVEHLKRGESVSILHAAEELTTQQAADLLNMSRPYLVRLVDRGDIPAHKVGTHRRIARHDVEAYRAKRDSERR